MSQLGLQTATTVSGMRESADRPHAPSRGPEGSVHRGAPQTPPSTGLAWDASQDSDAGTRPAGWEVCLRGLLKDPSHRSKPKPTSQNRSVSIIKGYPSSVSWKIFTYLLPK